MSPTAISAIVNYHNVEHHDKVVHLGTVQDKLRTYEPHLCMITDIKSCDESPRLDRNGFQLVHCPSKLKSDEFRDSDLVKARYYQECADIIKQETGASHVVLPLSHGIRQTTMQDAIALAEKVRLTKGDFGNVMAMNPAVGAHVDQSYKGAETFLRSRLSEADAKRLSKARYAIVNLWRPIKPVKRDPLAVCDWQSVSEADLQPATLVIPNSKHGMYGDREKELRQERWSVTFNPNHKWYYAADMQPDECLLIKCFDSSIDGTARLAPHCAFSIGDEDEPARESIEIRCLVFWE